MEAWTSCNSHHVMAFLEPIKLTQVPTFWIACYSPVYGTSESMSSVHVCKRVTVYGDDHSKRDGARDSDSIRTEVTANERTPVHLL